MNSLLVFPSSPTGNNRQIDLTGIDLWIIPRIDNVFVYPCDLNTDRLKNALSRTLSLWPLIAGRFLLLDAEHYVIEMSDNAIPVSFIDNTELTQWPLDSTIVHDTAEDRVQPFLDEVKSTKLLRGSLEEPLFRLKITRLVQSGEWVMGTSWAHVLGDAFTCLKFLNTFSRFYQELEPSKPLPIFERRLWGKDHVDRSLWPIMRHLRDTVTPEQSLEKYLSEQVTHDQLTIYFSGEQLIRLHSLIDDNSLTIHDVMISYIILVLNTYCFSNDEQLIRHTNIVVNYRGVSDSIAAPNLAANCAMVMWSDNFNDPYSLSSIAKSVRRSIIRSRDPKFLESWLATADELMKDMVRNDREVNANHFLNGIVVNSNFRFDWAGLVDFGHIDRCRFYTDGTAALFLRIFHLNPVYDGAQWTTRDREGAEVTFRIEKSMKSKFIDAWQQDLHENFVNVKK
jgi:hypothetical protein